SMNSAYLSKLCLTSSFKRTCRIVVFGCFDGAFRSAMCFLSLHHSWCITTCITKCLLRFLHAAKTRPRAARGGRERAHPNLGGWKPPKVGSLPPHLVVLPPSIFNSFPHV